MTDLHNLAGLIQVQPSATVSRTVMRAEGVRLVLFAFDTGEQLSEHTAAMPVVLLVLEGALSITADDRTIELTPGGLIHLETRTPHSVTANIPSKLALLMLDSRSAPWEE